MKTRALLIASLALLASCTLAPKYQRPASPVSQSWPNLPSTNATTQAAAEVDWRDFFAGDPRLQRLIAIALENNRDLRVAALRVEQLRAEYRIRIADLYPGIEGNGGLTKQKYSGAITAFAGGTVITTYYLNLNAGYELDLFGRIRSLKKEALEQYLASEEARRSAQIALIAEVANEYLTQLRLLENRAIANKTLETVQNSYNLIKASFEAGVASELDLRTAEGQVQTVKVNSANFLQMLAESQNALVQLIGEPLPADLPEGKRFQEQHLLTLLPTDLPSELLVRRPDVLAAEHTLQAANANIGAARAAYLPKILLTGSAGTASAKLTGLFTGPSETWSFAPQINVPIFEFGATGARLKQSKFQKQIEIANYEKAIQTAFREVADALAARAILDDKVRAQELLLNAQQKRFDLTTARYKQGVDNYVDVLLAQQDLYAAQQNLVQFQGARLLNSLALYKSLGGGWKPDAKR